MTDLAPDMVIEISDRPDALAVRTPNGTLKFTGAQADAIRAARALYADDATATAAFWRGLLLFLKPTGVKPNGKAEEGHARPQA